MDYAEEQAGEIEALMSIYEGDLEGLILFANYKVFNYKFSFFGLKILRCCHIPHLLKDYLTYFFTSLTV